jgi:hypothetical protein
MKQTGTKVVISIMMVAFIAVCAYAGDLEPPSGTPVSTMHALTEVYDLVNDTNTKISPLPCTGARSQLLIIWLFF